MFSLQGGALISFDLGQLLVGSLHDLLGLGAVIGASIHHALGDGFQFILEGNLLFGVLL